MLSLARRVREAIRIGHNVTLTVMAIKKDAITLRVDIKSGSQLYSDETTLNHRPGEHLKLGKSITVEILSFRFNSVRIGIQAPSHIPVHRDEVYAKEYRTAI